MGNSVTLQFDAQTAAYVQNVLKAKAAHEQMAQSADKMSESVLQMDGKVSKVSKTLEVNSEKLNAAAFGARNAGEAISGVGAGMALLGTVTATLGAAFKEHMEQMREKAKAFRLEIEQTSKVLASHGQLNFAGNQAASAAADRIGSDLFTKRDIVETYNAISKRTGAGVTADEKRRATAAAIQAGEAGHDDIAGFGETFAFLAKNARKGGGLEGVDDTQIGGMTAEIMKTLPDGLSEQHKRFLNRSKDKMQALNIILASSKSAEAARGLEAVEVEAFENAPDSKTMTEWRKHPRKMSDDDRRRQALYALPEEQRIAAMLADDSLVPDKSKRLVDNLRQRYDSDEVQRAGREDLLGTERRGTFDLEANDGRFKTVRDARRLEVREAEMRARNELPALLRSNQSKQMQLDTAEATGDDPGMISGIKGSFMRAKEAWERVKESSGLRDWTPEERDSGFLQEMKKQTGHLQDLNNKTRGNVTLGKPDEDN